MQPQMQPAHARVRVRPVFTLGQLIELWLEARAKGQRARSVYECLRVYAREIQPHPISKMRADHIDSRDVADFFRGMADRPGVARNAFAIISPTYSWARKQGLVRSNPAQGMSPPKAKSRQRVVTEAELREGWHAAPYAGDFGRILRLVMLTGARREEIGGLRWSEVNREARQLELPGERTKNGRPFILPLSDLALVQLPEPREGFPHLFGAAVGRGFQGWHEGSDRLALKLGYKLSQEKTWTLHDLRRTMVTQMAERGLAKEGPHIIEACVNHISGHKAAVAGVYNRATYLPQKREAFEAWSAVLARIVR